MNQNKDWSIDEIDSNNLTSTTIRSKSKSLSKQNNKDKTTNHSNPSMNTIHNNS